MDRLDNIISDLKYLLDTLIVYRSIVESGDCNVCKAKKDCKYVPRLGQQVRYNCPFYEEMNDDERRSD